MQNVRKKSRRKATLRRIGGMLAAAALTATLSGAEERNRDMFVLTSTNAQTNDVVVFKLNKTATPSLSLASILRTGGAGGATGNAGALQFRDGLGAVVNFGSNTVTQIVRTADFIRIGGTIKLAPGCTNPLSVALTAKQVFIAGANCAESHKWPSGNPDGRPVALPDDSAAQIAVGRVGRQLR